MLLVLVLVLVLLLVLVLAIERVIGYPARGQHGAISIALFES